MSLLERTKRLLKALRSGEQVDPEVVQQLSDDARVKGPALSFEQGRELAEALDTLVRALSAIQADQAQELGRAKQGKRALKGYGHAKPNTRSQRLRKRV